MKDSSDKIFADYVQAASLKNASLRYCFARDVLNQAQYLVEKFDYEIRILASELLNSTQSSGQTSTEESSRKEIDLAMSGSDPSMKNHEPEEPINFKSDEPEVRWFKDLFKKIAMKCHPDKVLNKNASPRQAHSMLSNYDRARQALTDGDKPEMVCVGIDLEIIGDLGFDLSYELLIDTINLAEVKTNNLHNSLAWAWGMANDDNKKKALILCEVFRQVYHTHLDEDDAYNLICKLDGNDDIFEKISKRHQRKVGKHPGPSLRQHRKKNE